MTSYADPNWNLLGRSFSLVLVPFSLISLISWLHEQEKASVPGSTERMIERETEPNHFSEFLENFLRLSPRYSDYGTATGTRASHNLNAVT